MGVAPNIKRGEEPLERITYGFSRNDKNPSVAGGDPDGRGFVSAIDFSMSEDAGDGEIPQSEHIEGSGTKPLDDSGEGVAFGAEFGRVVDMFVPSQADDDGDDNCDDTPSDAMSLDGGGEEKMDMDSSGTVTNVGSRYGIPWAGLRSQ